MNNHHHKDTKKLNFILRIYYGSKIVLFTMCFGSEVYYIKLVIYFKYVYETFF